MELTTQKLASLKKDFQSNPVNTLAMNAATRVEIQELAVNHNVLRKVHFSFSHELETAAEATAQKKLGICWMYAAFNWCREIAQRKLKVENIEFSGPYMVFWDKLEKCNYFLHKMVELIDLPVEDRLVWMFLKTPHDDGGSWFHFCNLIHKYGILPKAAMPETKYTEESTRMNIILSTKLRHYAFELRSLYKSGYSKEQLHEKCTEYDAEIYRILAITLGLPPERFDWSYRDKDKNFHRMVNITPQEFYQQTIGRDLYETYTLWNAPLSSMPYSQTYTIAHTNTIREGKPLISLNLPMPELKKIALKMLQEDEVCMFSCDVGQESHRKDGILYKGLYDYGLVFQTRFDVLDKGTRLEYSEGKLSHSMLFTGVDLVNDKPTKWKVENSWGTDFGKKGYFIMSDEWFDEYVYEIVVPKKYLTSDMLQNFQKPPVELPYWHPIA
ncbi:MAG: C1 family peptidase [Candidatus Brocadiae bacterium]|nr:C1 family peptidase [Candidatus Brocadiia bacterium]